MQGKPFRVAALPDFLDQLIEIILAAPVGGPYPQVSRPGNAGVHDAIKVPVIRVQGEFIRAAVAAFSGLGVAVAGQGIYRMAIGTPQYLGGLLFAAFIQQHLFPCRLGGKAVDMGPVQAILYIKLGLQGIAGSDPGVNMVVRPGRPRHVRVG